MLVGFTVAPATVVVPTNSGLVFVKERGRSLLSGILDACAIQEARGEDIPLILEKTRAIGITGEDILANYLAADGRAYKSLLIDCVWKGVYENSLFGLPALCVIGRKGLPPVAYAQYYRQCAVQPTPSYHYLAQKKVVIPKRYEQLIRKKTAGIPIDFISIDRKIDVILAIDSSIDFAIDIVLTGKTTETLGLGIYDVLFKSNGILIWSDGE